MILGLISAFAAWALFDAGYHGSAMITMWLSGINFGTVLGEYFGSRP